MSKPERKLVTIVPDKDVNYYKGTKEAEIPASAINSATQFYKEGEILIGMYRTNKSNLDFPTTPKVLADGKSIANFNFGYSGAAGIVQGLREIAENPDKTVTFVIADHPNRGGFVYDTMTVGIGIDDYNSDNGGLSAQWRICNEAGSPTKSGSEALIHGADESLEAACAMIAIRLKRPNCDIFRQPEQTELNKLLIAGMKTMQETTELLKNGKGK